MKFKISIIYFILLAIIFAGLLFIYNRNNDILKSSNSDLQEERSVFEHHEITYHSLILRLAENLKKDLNSGDKIIVTDKKGGLHDFKDIIGDSLKLIYRFKESSCDACYSDQLLKLKKLSQVIGKNAIILLVSFPRQNDLKILTSTYDLDFPIYNVDSKLISNYPLEKNIEPYLFLIDKEYRASYFFIPDKTIPDLSIKYMDIIKKLFSNKV